MFFFFKKRHKKKKNKQKWTPDPASASTRKKFQLSPKETEKMYSAVRVNLSADVTLKR